MKSYLVLFSLLLTQHFLQAQIVDRAKFSIGETLEIESQVLQEKRTLNIYLPESYHRDSLKAYPVIYLLDGSRDEDFIHIAGLVQFCSFSWINIIPESIVVGIGNVDRKKDFTYPTKNSQDKLDFPTTGSSENFIRFMEEELQGLISKTYRVTNSKTIIGQSLGGLLATEILFKKPDLFDHYVIVSPSLWWDDESLLKDELKTFSKKKSIYIGVGKEGAVMERVAKALHHKLEGLKDQNVNLFYQYFEQQSHGDALHLAVYDSFEKMFKPKEEKKD